MSYEDKVLVCLDCGAEFTFTAKQQEYFAEKGFTAEPKRCSDCRAKRRDLRESGGARGGGQRSPAPRRDGPRESAAEGTGPRRPRELHPAVCSACGQQTQVPFKPLPGRPVYCRECHQARKQQ